ncbi:MAG TPA: VWA domain-containing protein [Opitutaceae bacterium]|nr:VWA domain-containing protein [Opitutaceae bacterium]
MKHITRRRVTASVLAGLFFASLLSSSAESDQKKKKEDASEKEEVVLLSPFTVEAANISSGYSATSTLAGTRFGATPGGAKDVRYFRDAVKAGQFPHPNTITAEGLFSEHDLPLKGASVDSKDLLILNGEAVSAKVIGRPEVCFLAQLGFSSGLEVGAWHRAALNIVAVVDKSGSMNGAPIELVKQSLHQVVSHLGADDQISIVLYGDRSHVFLHPTPTTKGNLNAINDAIDAIAISGSTNMEEGLKVGFALARESKKTFRGTTRIMQFTDERPNVGDTSPEGFMGMMEAGSRDGIGQTTIGIGEQFGAELAARIATVRGGNLFFFPDVETAGNVFDEEFDTLVTELAYDLEVTIRPVPGMRLAGVYGIPGEMLKWVGDDGRDVRFQVNTIFLSKKKGAIYLAFAQDREDLPARIRKEGKSLAKVELSYLQVGKNSATKSYLDLPLVAAENASLGLLRGGYLVSEYVALKEAMVAHHTENNQEKAFGVLGELHELFRSTTDKSLENERQLVDQLFLAMTKASGHAG